MKFTTKNKSIKTKTGKHAAPKRAVKRPRKAKTKAESLPPTLYERLKDFVGIVEMPPDWARNHDHYIHGSPKK